MHNFFASPTSFSPPKPLAVSPAKTVSPQEHVSLAASSDFQHEGNQDCASLNISLAIEMALRMDLEETVKKLTHELNFEREHGFERLEALRRELAEARALALNQKILSETQLEELRNEVILVFHDSWF